MNKLKYIIFTILLVACTKNIYAYTFDNTLKIYDYAQVLKDNEATKLKEQAQEYINQYNADMVMVLVKYYSQKDLKSYISEFYMRNNFGSGINSSGIILGIDVKNNDSYIGVFGDANNRYSDFEIDNILNIINKKTKYYDKLNSFVKYTNEYVTISLADSKKDIENKNVFLSINWLFILLSSLILGFLGSSFSFIELDPLQPIIY